GIVRQEVSRFVDWIAQREGVPPLEEMEERVRAGRDYYGCFNEVNKPTVLGLSTVSICHSLPSKRAYFRS
ncbi:MAG: hypothetical protein ACP5OO_08075, partial [Chloroflexia bacterium]